MIYGFDWDGTLIESWTATPLPGARAQLAALPPDARTFIATNQAGPVFRLVTGQRKYPTVAHICATISDGLAALAWRPRVLLLCCCSGRPGAAYWRAEAAVAAEFRSGPRRCAAWPALSHIHQRLLMGWWAGWAPGQRPAAELRRQSIGKVSSENQLSNFLMVSTELPILDPIPFCTQHRS